MASHLRDKEIRIIVYMDVFLIAHQNRKLLEAQTQISISFLEDLEWVINYEKPSLVSKTRCEFLGLVWDTLEDRVSLPSRKKKSLENHLSKLLTLKRYDWITAIEF
ncbi:unnamed protein product [Psylliodes chrysocephalus]|uniref:Reverse transcriptase domain-containing protein n=1 Tax=Psylliodes chrysocephalus TaxID=3402493 RepID=A0A9P0GF20_9CUCU|nr:unnamed protein product [Psylliodes chrysocephala]